MKWLNFLAIVPIIIGVLVFKNAVSSRPEPEKNTKPEAILKVETAEVAELSLPRLLGGFGTVVAERQWTAVPQISGKVTQVHPNLKTGRRIAKGQVLFVVETIDQGLEQERILADSRALESEIAQINSRRKRLDQSLVAAQGTLKLLKKEEERYRKLFEAGATPASTVDAQTRAVLNQERVIKDIEASIESLPAQVDGVRARISASRANLQKVGVEIGRSIVRAPFNGTLGEVYLEAGQVVSSGSQLFTMQGSDQVRVEARFPQAQLAQFPLKSATIISPSGRELTAQVGPLRENVDPVSRTASVQLTVPAADATLLPGALVQVVLTGESHEPYPVVPRSAVHNDQVFVVDGERLGRVQITTAFREGDQIAVDSGLKAGDTIVVSDPGLAVDGTLVQVATKEK